MAQYVSGDRLAFRRLFEILAPRVRGFFMRAFSDPALADDLTQATFMKLHGARASYQSDRALRPWIFTIASSVRRDELRRRHALPRLEEGDWDNLESADTGPDGPAATTDTARGGSGPDLVRKAIDRLPETLRVVVQLHQYQGLTFAEIAARLGATPGAVRVRASRAYERLRAELHPILRSAK